MADDSRPDKPTALAAPEGGDFQRLRESGEPSGLSWALGGAFCASRDALARVLIRLGATPNRISLTGFLLTCAAGYCLARGAGHQVPYFRGGPGLVSFWPAWAGLFLILAGAADMLDGAVARVGRLQSTFGAILDSALDRLSDMAVFIGCAAHFAWHGNLTYQLLAMIALGNAVLISYVKARAEDVLPACGVGWWMRGERAAAVLIGCLVGHVPFVLWQQATLPLLTVLRRLRFSYQSAGALDAGDPAPRPRPRPGWRGWLQPWRHPRGSLPYDVVVGFNIGCIIFCPLIWPDLLAAGRWTDPLARWLGRG
jgi:CDP-diacylglycerol--glycerol-3-phosphate 3-phosphatidyltransferase